MPQDENRVAQRRKLIERLVDFVYQTFILFDASPFTVRHGADHMALCYRLADCENLVIIGLGEGCNAVHALVNKRREHCCHSGRDRN